MNIDKMDIACNLIEIQYIEKMKEIIDCTELDDYLIRKVLFPNEWYYIEDKELKLRALREALHNNILLSNTEEINDYYRNKYR